MSILIEDYVPVVKYEGLNTAKAVSMTSTLAVTGAITATGGVAGAVAGAVAATTLTASGLVTIPNPRVKVTVTDYDAQNATLTIAGLLAGVVTQNSKTGASTAVTPTGAEISTGVSGVAVGFSFDCLYYNRGDQTSTITAGASGVTVYGTAAIATLKTAILKFVCTAANTWSCYVVAGA